MLLLNTRDNRLALFMRNMADFQDMNPDRAAARQIMQDAMDSAAVTPAGASRRTDRLGSQIHQLAGDTTAELNNMLNPADRPRVMSNLQNLVSSELNAQEGPGLTPLQRRNADTQATIQRYVTPDSLAGNTTVFDIPEDSPWSQRLVDVRKSQEAQKRVDDARAYRTSPEGRDKLEQINRRIRDKARLQQENRDAARAALDAGSRSLNSQKSAATSAANKRSTAMANARQQLADNYGKTWDQITDEEVRQSLGQSYTKLDDAYNSAQGKLDAKLAEAAQRQAVIDKADRFNGAYTRVLNELDTPEKWAAKVKGPASPVLPIPGYAVTGADGLVDPSKAKQTPRMGQGLLRRAVEGQLAQEAVDRVAASRPDASIPGRLYQASEEILPYALGSSPNPPKPPLPVVTGLPSVSGIPAAPAANSFNPLNLNIPSSARYIPSPGAAQAASSAAQAPPGLGVAGKTGRWLGEVTGKLRAGTSEVQDAFNQAVDRLNTGIANRQAASSPFGPFPAPAPTTASAIPTSSASPAAATAAPSQPKGSNAFRGKVTTPAGEYKAEVEVPQWFRDAQGRGQTSTKVTAPSTVEIPNRIVDGSLLDNVKGFYRGLGPGTKKAVLGGGLGLAGLGLLAAGGQKAAQDRSNQEARARELAAIAERPPARPENQLSDLGYNYPPVNNYGY